MIITQVMKIMKSFSNIYFLSKDILQNEAARQSVIDERRRFFLKNIIAYFVRIFYVKQIVLMFFFQFNSSCWSWFVFVPTLFIAISKTNLFYSSLKLVAFWILRYEEFLIPLSVFSMICLYFGIKVDFLHTQMKRMMMYDFVVNN